MHDEKHVIHWQNIQVGSKNGNKFLTEVESNLNLLIVDLVVSFQVEPDGEFLVEPLCILDRREIELRKRVVTQVKVQ